MTPFPPTPKFRITQRFANPGRYATRSDSHGAAGHHSGTDYGRALDMSTLANEPIHSCTPGTVVISEWNSTMGNWVGVYYAADDVTITYWHMADRAVSRGDTVTRGQLLGRVGSSGNSTGPHIHVQANRGRGFDYHGHIDPAPWVATVPGQPRPSPRSTMQFVSRAQWGARDRNGRHPIGSTLGVTLHWEGPHMGTFRHDQCAAKVRGIQHFHMVDRGWSDIAYNAVVCPHGFVFEGRGVWNKSAANGWAQVNDDWYAVCYLGGEGDGFTDDGKAGMVDAVQWLRDKGGAGPRVNGHRDHKATACPGDEIHRWLQSADFNARTDEEFTVNEQDEQKIEAIVERALTAQLARQSKWFGFRTKVNTGAGKGNLNQALQAIVSDLAAVKRKVTRIEAKVDAETEPAPEPEGPTSPKA